MTIHDSLAPAPDVPGQALADWSMSCPSTGHERAVREDLAVLMREARRLREAWFDVSQALEDLAHKLRDSSEEAASGQHESPWLDGYRVGYLHAEIRTVGILREMLAAMKIRQEAPR